MQRMQDELGERGRRKKVKGEEISGKTIGQKKVAGRAIWGDQLLS